MEKAALGVLHFLKLYCGLLREFAFQNQAHFWFARRAHSETSSSTEKRQRRQQGVAPTLSPGPPPWTVAPSSPAALAACSPGRVPARRKEGGLPGACSVGTSTGQLILVSAGRRQWGRVAMAMELSGRHLWGPCPEELSLCPGTMGP